MILVPMAMSASSVNAIGMQSATSAVVSGTCRGGCGGRREGGGRVCWRVVSKDADSRWVSSERSSVASLAEAMGSGKIGLFVGG